MLIAGGELNVNSKTGTTAPLPPEESPHQHLGMQYGGERQAAIDSPRAEHWKMAPSMSLDPAGTPFSGGRWYPTLVTLGDGQVLAVGGHIDRNERYERNGAVRHSNNTPERYRPSSNHWTLLASDPPTDDQITSDFGATVVAWDYQRTHLLPDGRVFFASPVRGRNRVYDASSGSFSTDPDEVVTPPPDAHYQQISARYTSVMLPLLHQEGFRPRVLLFGASQAYRIDLGTWPTQWVATPARVGWDAAPYGGTPPFRYFVVPVLLPTGEVFLTGGTALDGDDAAHRQPNVVLRTEQYDPGIDWGTGKYVAGTDGWAPEESTHTIEVGRHYHSTALLMPDGAVWTAGSNGPSSDGGGRERRIEIFRPWYFDGAHQGNRPVVTSSPGNISYGFEFPVGIASERAHDIQRVVLLRCGSCTHGFNPDQRYLSVKFSVDGADRLKVYAPPRGDIAPPGPYLLWVIDDQGRPSAFAPFVRLSSQKCFITEEVSTYSVHEVVALGTPALFAPALFVVFDGFVPGEVTKPSLEFVNAGQPVSGIEYSVGSALYEGDPQDIDVGQRVSYPINITFTSTAPFDLIPADQDFHDIQVNASMDYAHCGTTITLSRNPNPRMNDGYPHWLSTDVRVFKVLPGETFSAGVQHPTEGATAPHDYIKALVQTYDAWAPSTPGAPHPFDGLPTDLESNRRY